MSTGDIVLTRAGHYHVPSGDDGAGVCQAAQIVGTNDDGTVNLACWEHDGDPFQRQNVEVTLHAEGESTDPLPTDHATFHLSRSCPYGR